DLFLNYRDVLAIAWEELKPESQNAGNVAHRHRNCHILVRLMHRQISVSRPVLVRYGHDVRFPVAEISSGLEHPAGVLRKMVDPLFAGERPADFRGLDEQVALAVILNGPADVPVVLRPRIHVHADAWNHRNLELPVCQLQLLLRHLKLPLKVLSALLVLLSRELELVLSEDKLLMRQLELLLRRFGLPLGRILRFPRHPSIVAGDYYQNDGGEIGILLQPVPETD